MLGVSVLGRARGKEVTPSGSGFESQLYSFLTLYPWQVTYLSKPPFSHRQKDSCIHSFTSCFGGEPPLSQAVGIESLKVGTGLACLTTSGAAMAGAELARERLEGEEIESQAGGILSYDQPGPAAGVFREHLHLIAVEDDRI